MRPRCCCSVAAGVSCTLSRPSVFFCTAFRSGRPEISVYCVLPGASASPFFETHNQQPASNRQGTSRRVRQLQLTKLALQQPAAPASQHRCVQLVQLPPQRRNRLVLALQQACEPGLQLLHLTHPALPRRLRLLARGLGLAPQRRSLALPLLARLAQLGGRRLLLRSGLLARRRHLQVRRETCAGRARVRGCSASAAAARRIWMRQAANQTQPACSPRALPGPPGPPVRRPCPTPRETACAPAPPGAPPWPRRRRRARRRPPPCLRARAAGMGVGMFGQPHNACSVASCELEETWWAPPAASTQQPGPAHAPPSPEGAKRTLCIRLRGPQARHLATPLRLRRRLAGRQLLLLVSAVRGIECGIPMRACCFCAPMQPAAL